MTTSAQIEVSTAVLVWARKQRGLDVAAAAKRLGVSESRLAEFEAGAASPTLTQLRKMVEVYKRPLIVLLLDEVPTTFTPLTDYRSFSDDESHQYTPALLDEIRRAVVQRNTYNELLKEMGQTLVTKAVPSTGDGPAALAQQLRQFLNVSYAEQRTWRSPEVAFAEWKKRVEGVGVMVIETSRVDTKEMRGFSLADEKPYVIAVNGQDAPRGKVFTLLHELAHLSERNGGVCDLHQFNRAKDDLEVYCNAVAGEALFPQDEIRKTKTFTAHVSGTPWSDAEIDALVQVGGGASQEVVVRRLLQLGALGDGEYKRRRDEYLAKYEEFRKARRGSEKKGGPPPYRMQIRDRGKPFIRSVLDAYSDRIITLSYVSDLAGVRVKHLANLQHEAYR